MFKNLKSHVLFFVLCFVLSVAGIMTVSLLSAYAADVPMACRVTWDANTESDLKGYKLHIGTVSGEYTSSVTINKDLTEVTCAQAGIVEPGTYFVMLKAFDTVGNFSDPSDEDSANLIANMSQKPTGFKIVGNNGTTIIIQLLPKAGRR